MEPALARTRLETMTSAAKSAGVKLTHQRLEVFRAIAGTDVHPDAEQLFRQVKRRVPTISLDTVYRTLWTLADLGLVRTVGPRGDGHRFDANLAPHHHFTCVDCGLVRDFESPALDAPALPAELATIGEVLDRHVEVRGVCAACLGKRTKKA